MRAATMHSEAASGLSGLRTPAAVLPLRFCALGEGWPVKHGLQGCLELCRIIPAAEDPPALE